MKITFLMAGLSLSLMSSLYAIGEDSDSRLNPPASSRPFQLQRVLVDEEDGSFSLDLKLETEKGIQGDLRDINYPVHKTEVSFFTIRNKTNQVISFGGFKIPAGRSRLLTQTFDNHEGHADISLEGNASFLLSLMPTEAQPDPKLSPLKTWRLMGSSVITFVSADEWYKSSVNENHGLIYKEYPYAVVMREVACDPNDWFKSTYEANKGAIFIESRADGELAQHRLNLYREKEMQKKK